MPATQVTQETLVPFLGLEDPLEKGMTTHSSILAWRIPWIKEPGGLQSKGSQRVGHDCAPPPPHRSMDCYVSFYVRKLYVYGPSSVRCHVYLCTVKAVDLTKCVHVDCMFKGWRDSCLCILPRFMRKMCVALCPGQECVCLSANLCRPPKPGSQWGSRRPWHGLLGGRGLKSLSPWGSKDGE